MKTLLIITLFLGNISFGQIEFGNAYLIGNKVNIAIHGERGKEGVDTSAAGFHQRAPGDRCGFVADPFGTGWNPTGFNGDYFMPGAQEGGWGLQIDGINYGNNYNIYEIPFNPDNTISHTVVGEKITAEWEGDIVGIKIKIKYILNQDELFYTTDITLINNSGEDKTDIYYYRNIDPDNNQTLGELYITTNTIQSQPIGDCNKALVSAESFSPHDSYIGFGAAGDKFRVSHGGFSNRNASLIWNASGLEGDIGEEAIADAAISLAYKTDLAADDSIHFSFLTIFSEDVVSTAFGSLYSLNYLTDSGLTGSSTSETLHYCSNDSIILFVEGDLIDDHEWIWTNSVDGTEIINDSIKITPSGTITYTVTPTDATCIPLNPRSIVISPYILDYSISENTTIFSGESTLLEATGGDFYSWTPTTGLSDPTTANPTASPLETTEYTVTISNGENDCMDTLSVTVTILFLSNEKNTGYFFSVYPNPSSNPFFIQTNYPKPFLYKIYATDGKLIYQGEQITNGEVNITIAKGIYLLEIITEDEIVSKKIIIK